jgi:hypothetical protein
VANKLRPLAVRVALVNPQRLGTAECFRTAVARMDNLGVARRVVFPQVAAACKRRLALAARQGLLALVDNPHVIAQLGPRAKGLRASRTGERSLFFVAHEMLAQLGRGHRLKVTKVTPETVSFAKMIVEDMVVEEELEPGLKAGEGSRTAFQAAGKLPLLHSSQVGGHQVFFQLTEGAEFFLAHRTLRLVGFELFLALMHKNVGLQVRLSVRHVCALAAIYSPFVRVTFVGVAERKTSVRLSKLKAKVLEPELGATGVQIP